MKGKLSHTEQLLNYESHHHTLGVIRTFYDRKDNIATEEVDNKGEEKEV